MTTLNITSADRRALRGLAHHIDPVVMVGQHGVTPAVLHEIDNALAAHELIKVRVHNDDRDERAAMLVNVCETLSCAPVQHLGKLFVLFRPGKKKAKGDDAPARPAKERPRHTDFPKAPPRASASEQTRPRVRQSTPTEPARRRRTEDDPWSDLPPSVRQRIDPDYTGPAPYDSERRPRARAGAASATGARGTGERAAKTFGAHGPRAGVGATRAKKPPFGSAPATRRRLNDDETVAKPPTTKKATDERFRWKDKDKGGAPSERAPRPSTHTEPKKNVRGAARKTATQSRRRLRDAD
jgi:RNA-binding protein